MELIPTTTLTLKELLVIYKPILPKKCRTTTKSGCGGSLCAWGVWHYPPGQWALVMPPYRLPLAWRCDRCGHWSFDEGHKDSEVMQVTRNRDVIWQSDDDAQPPDLSNGAN